MDPERWSAVRRLFEEALDVPVGERAAWLSEACASDDALRAEVERMLAVEAPGGFLENPKDATAIASLPAPAAARTIGNYVLVRPIAAGGMGVVYEAMQERPRRKVALKVMRLGLGGAADRRRFRYEAEILARLVHPGIAQIHEAGVHEEDGVETPYFAMEFVEGARDIGTYAREHALDLPGRIELFIAICDAVHHGHLRGVIHRDLKPANLLVDGAGRTKVIDFGVARLLDPDAAALTRATRTGELVGTLWYMSPEQLSGDDDSIDARADVYALGVVLYELLCGRLPYPLQGLALTAVARAVAHHPPDPMGPEVPQDLSWVAQRALEKDAARRYASASELALDLRRFLADEPVLAGPPSTLYRIRKFAVRHSIWVSAAGLVVIALVLGTLAALVGLSRARAEARRASDESTKFRALNEVLVETLSAVELGREGREVRAYELLDRAAERIRTGLDDRPDVRVGLELALAQSYLNLGLYEEAEVQARNALTSLEVRPAGDSERLVARQTLATCLHDLGRQAEALEVLVGAPEAAAEAHGAGSELALSLARVELQAKVAAVTPLELEASLAALEARAREHLGLENDVTRKIVAQRVRAASDLGRWDEALRLNDELIDTYSRSDGAEAYTTVGRRLAAARILATSGRLDESIAAFEASLESWVERLGEDHPLALTALHNCASALADRGRTAEADALWTPIVPKLERVLGPDHATTLNARGGLALTRTKLGDARRSEQTLRDLVLSARRLWGADHLRTADHEYNLGALLADTGGMDKARFEEAEALLQHALEVRQRDLPLDHERALNSLDGLGLLYYRRGALSRAEPCFRQALEGYRRTLGAEHPSALKALANLSTTLARLGRYDDALPFAVESLRLNEQAHGEAHPNVLVLVGNLGALHNLRGAPRQAQEYFELVLARAEGQLPPEDNRVLGWQCGHAESLMGQGQHARARELLVALIPMSARGDRNAHTARLLTYARCLEQLQELEQAVEQLLLAYEIRRELGGERHGATRQVARELARLLAALGRTDEAATWSERAGGG